MCEFGSALIGNPYRLPCLHAMVAEEISTEGWLMADSADTHITWREKLQRFGGRWLNWFGYWALADSLMHLAQQHFHWNLFGPPRDPGGFLFFNGWMSFWFTLISPRLGLGGWSKRRLRLGGKRPTHVS